MISNASWTIKILGDFGAHNAWHHTCESGPAKRGGGEIPGYLGISWKAWVFFSDTFFVLKWPVFNIDFDGFGNTCSPQIFRCVCWRRLFFCGLSFKISLFQHRTRKLTSAFLSAMGMGKWNLHEEVDSLTGEQISSDFFVTVRSRIWWVYRVPKIAFTMYFLLVCQ